MILKNHIEKTGYRASVRIRPKMRRAFDINVRTDKKGEFFAVDMRESTDAIVLSVEGDHALLMFKDGNEKFKALIGHDERQLFVAAVPDNSVSTVLQAKESLKPTKIQKLDKGLKEPHKRKTKKRVRQGDFFFVPVDHEIENPVIHKREPLNRGAGRSHICDELVRYGGHTVYFHRRFKPGRTFTQEQFKFLMTINKEAPKTGWVNRREGMQVYVRGKIRHPEHKTLVLKTWHEVIPNVEAGWLKNISFID